MIRNRTTAALLLATLTGCAVQPAHADAFPPGFQMRHTDHINTPQAAAPARSNTGVTLPRGLPPIDSPALRGGPAPGLVYDPPVGGLSDEAPWRPGVGALVTWNPPGIVGQGLGGNAGGNNNGGNLQTGGNGGGNQGCGNGNSGPNGGNCDRPDRPQPDVPGPLPILGAAAAFGWSRQLRRRARR